VLPSGRQEAVAIFSAPGDPTLSRARSAASARSGLVRAMRPRITRYSSSAIALIASMASVAGACWEQPQQDWSDLDLPHPAEGTGRFPCDNRIRVLQQFEQQRDGWQAMGVHSDSGRRGSQAVRAAAMARSHPWTSRP